MSSYTKYIDPGVEKFIAESKELENAYIEACEWISSLGITYKKTRFGTYEKDVENFLGNRDTETAEESVKIFMNAHMEANELIRVKKAFESLDSESFLETIKKSISGQRFRNVNKEDQSRDFAFELGVASRFLKAKYNVDLRSISDLVVDIDGRKLYVECKRIKSYKQLEKRVKTANQQIKARLSNDHSSKSRGMIALNLTDVINPEAKPIIAPNVDAYRHKSASILKDFVLSNKPKLSKNRHKKCLGALTEFTTQGLIYTCKVEDMAFVNIREGNIYQYLISNEDMGFLNGFWEKLGNQHIL